MPRSLFPQNVIAMIWDFDKTLSPDYMQQPLFRKFNVDEKTFWKEANGLAEFYRRGGMHNLSRDTLYLNHILTYVERGIFQGLNNQMLFELGAEIDLFEGLPKFFGAIKEQIGGEQRFSVHDITVEHYIVSTGLRQMIMGSGIAPYVDDVWGCEFAESIGEPGYLDKDPTLFDTTDAVIRAVGYAIDNTTKTRALFEINKGSNKLVGIDVNATVAPEDRRVPFQNMIYIADGPSDVPAFSIVNQYGGRTFAVYKPRSFEHFQSVDRLQKENRVQGIGEASYVEGSLTAMWVTNAVQEIAGRIVADRDALLRQRVGSVPQHVLSDVPEKQPQKRPVLPATSADTPQSHEVLPTGTAGDSEVVYIGRSPVLPAQPTPSGSGGMKAPPETVSPGNRTKPIR
jgi:hypothetical protein